MTSKRAVPSSVGAAPALPIAAPVAPAPLAAHAPTPTPSAVPGVLGEQRQAAQRARTDYEAALRAHFLGEDGVPVLGAVDLMGSSSIAWSEDDRFSVTFYRSAIAGLRLLARLLEVDEVDPGLKRELFDRSLRHLPLFWTGAQAAAWRAGGYTKYWNGCSKGDQKRYLASLEDPSTPWEGFHCPWHDDNPGQGKIWGHWLEHVPTRELLGMVRRTLGLFEAAAQDPALVAKDDTLGTNVGRVATRLGLSEVQRSMWTVWLGLHHQGFVAQDVLALACERASYEEEGLARWYELLGTALGGTVFDVEALFGRSSSPLARAGLLLPRYGEHLLPRGKNGRPPSFWEVFDFHNMGSVQVWGRRCSTDEEFIANFVRVSTAGDEGLTLDAFEHLRDDVGRMVQALRHERPVKVLLWGTPGSGKTQLAHLLLAAAGKVVAEPGALGAMPSNGTSNRTIDHGQTRLGEVAIAQRMAPMLGEAGLLIDECEAMLNNVEHKLHVNERLDQTFLPQVWIANDLGGIHPAFLRRFDAVLHVPPMPLWARERLAAKLFQDTALAQRVAQAMHTPAEVVSAHQWCESVGRFDWATVATRMAGYQRALMAVARDDLDDFAVTVVPPSLDGGGLSNLAGYSDLRRVAQELAHVFSHPEHYRRLGAKIPRGVLLAGEPGTGKTLFARSVASEVGVPMVMADASSLAEVPARIGQLFAEARKHAPCMVFLDEIDAIASNVRGPDGSLSTDKQKILNRLLVELDGFEPLDGVMVLAATHRAPALDPALLRSGRLGRTVPFRAPHQEDRVHIWQHHTRGMPLGALAGEGHDGRGATVAGLDPTADNGSGHVVRGSDHGKTIDWEQLAQASAGFSGADIAEAANLAALMAAQGEQATVTQDNLQDACDRVFWGEGEGGLPLSEAERWGTAVHEAGHALMVWKNGVRVERITVRPRPDSLGAVHWTEDEGKHSLSVRDLDARLEILLGGIAAETTVFGAYGSGGESDLDQAHGLLRGALQRWGMGTTLGTSALGASVRLSEGTLAGLEHEERARMKAAYSTTLAWLDGHRALLEELACHLQTVHEMSGTQVRRWLDGRLDRLVAPVTPVNDPDGGTIQPGTAQQAASSPVNRP